jgi:hypothetical protein
VPLRSNGFARGIVARMPKDGVVLFGFFFGPKMQSVNELSFEGVERSAAIAELRFGDLGLVNGNWSIIGSLPNWSPKMWGMPDFVRRDPLGRKAWGVRYSDLDPTIVKREYLVEYEVNLQNNWLLGYGAVELHLTELLA